MNLSQMINDSFIDNVLVPLEKFIYAGGAGSGKHKTSYENEAEKDKSLSNSQKEFTKRYAELVPLKELLPLREYNWGKDKNRQGAEGWKDLVEDVTRHGIREPVIVRYFPDTDRAIVIEGNHRIGAAKEAGEKEVPVRVLTARYPQKEYGHATDGGKVSGYKVKNEHIPADLKPSKIGLSGRIITDEDIKAGGVGSGCKGHHCGRPRKKDEGKQSRAKASYNPSNRAKQIQAENNEKALAKALGGASHIGDNAAFDVIVSKARVAFEVKTIIAGKRDAITMHPSSRERKEKAWKDMKLKNVFTVIFDDRHGKIYYGEGVKNFRIKSRRGEPNPSVKEISNLKQLRKLL